MGGGSITVVTILALKEKLRATFYDKDSGDHLSMLTQNMNERLIRLEEADKRQWQPVADAIENMAHVIDKQGREIAVTAALLDEISRRLTSLEQGHGGKGHERMARGNLETEL